MNHSNNTPLNSESERLGSVGLNDWVYVNVTESGDHSHSLEKQHKMADDIVHSSRSDQAEHQETKTWLDDLPVDKEHSGVGFSYNQEYKDDGYKHQYHVFEDKCLRFKVSESCYLYGVFDGHSGTKAAEFIAQRLPAEILLGQLNTVESDEDIQQVLRQAYHTVENSYFASLDDLIAERTSLQEEIETYKDTPLQLKPELVERLRVVDDELSSGSSALVALIYNGKMYVANIGNSRALLCRTESGKLRVEKLNDDHTLENEEEVERLHKLGFPREQLTNSTRFGQQLYTRCIGDYSVKGGYKDNEQMRCAISEPVIAVPDVEEPIQLDASCNFLLLMSDGVYRSIVDSTETSHVNGDIAGMVASEFPRQSTLNGVSQAVIDRITRTHHDAFALARPGDSKHSKCSSRDDMTLLIRNFNYSLRSQSNEKLPHPNTASLTSLPSPQNVSSGSEHGTPTDPSPATNTNSSTYNFASNPFFAQLKSTPMQSILDTLNIDPNLDSFADSIKSTGSVSTLDLDADGKIEPYVSFDDLDTAMAAMTEKQRQDFEQRLLPKMDCETIMEHPEGVHESG